MDLVSIQNSGKPIRNPFGFDFTVKYAHKPIVLKGDGEWVSVVGPLRDHIARHLYMKIRYQYHDEQTAAMKAKGDHTGARSYSVPAEIENKIWFLITGEKLHNNADVADQVNDEADLTVLKNEIKALDRKVSTQAGPINVTKILNKAMNEALPQGQNLAAHESTHTGGSESLSDGPEQPPIDRTPVDAKELGGQLPQSNTEGNDKQNPMATAHGKDEGKGNREFAELDDLG